MADDFEPAQPENRRAQVAIDAFGVRQHLAETLLRFLEARIAIADAEPGSKSLWFALATGPTKTQDVVDAVETGFAREDRHLVSELLLPSRLIAAGPTPAANEALRIAVAWIRHAVGLLTRTDLPLSAGNNKTKHGMAVRHVDDVRIDAVSAPELDPSRIPLGVMEGRTGISIPVIDRPILKLLSARPTRRGAQYTKEADHVWIQLDVVSLISEATALNHVLRAAFHVAATEHRARTGSPDAVSAHIDLTRLPEPRQVLDGRHIMGLRFPVTAASEPATVVFREVGLSLPLPLGPRRSGVIVADDPAPEADPEAVRT